MSIKDFMIRLSAPAYKKLLRKMLSIPAYSLIDKSNANHPKLMQVFAPELGDVVKYVVEKFDMPLKKIKSEKKIYPCKVQVRIDKVYE